MIVPCYSRLENDCENKWGLYYFFDLRVVRLPPFFGPVLEYGFDGFDGLPCLNGGAFLLLCDA